MFFFWMFLSDDCWEFRSSDPKYSSIFRHFCLVSANKSHIFLNYFPNLQRSMVLDILAAPGPPKECTWSTVRRLFRLVFLHRSCRGSMTNWGAQSVSLFFHHLRALARPLPAWAIAGPAARRAIPHRGRGSPGGGGGRPRAGRLQRRRRGRAPRHPAPYCCPPQPQSRPRGPVVGWPLAF